MKRIIRIEKKELTPPRRHWVRNPKTQVVPRKKRPSRKAEKQILREGWKKGLLG
ncbi:MAG: hypothetical protein PHX83_02950 [Acidobacteriia bacterium]|nr:hypothetical protein [Terriglobia bacterium]